MTQFESIYNLTELAISSRLAGSAVSSALRQPRAAASAAAPCSSMAGCHSTSHHQQRQRWQATRSARYPCEQQLPKQTDASARVVCLPCSEWHAIHARHRMEPASWHLLSISKKCNVDSHHWPQCPQPAPKAPPLHEVGPHMVGVRSDAEFDAFLDTSKPGTAVVEFGTSWCVKCHEMFPKFYQLSKQVGCSCVLRVHSGCRLQHVDDTTCCVEQWV